MEDVQMVSVLRYGNTNTYFIRGTEGGILVDTDWAGTLPGFYRALKANQLSMKDIRYVLPPTTTRITWA